MTPKFTPGTLGAAAASAPNSVARKATEQQKKKDAKDIWDDDDMVENEPYEDVDDGRTRPEYEILFKQKVSSMDVFGGIDGKDGSSNCCEDLVIKVWLPGTKFSDVKLEVTNKHIDVRSPKFKLIQPLPHEVESEKGTAKFDSKKGILSVTVPRIPDTSWMNDPE